MFVLFFTQRVDSVGEIKQCLCERRIPSVEIHQPTRRYTVQANTEGLPGNSFAQVGKVINNEYQIIIRKRLQFSNETLFLLQPLP